MRLAVKSLLLMVGMGIACLIILQGLELYLGIQAARIPSYKGGVHPGIYLEHPSWGYYHKPGLRFEVRHVEFTPELVINSLGFRGGRGELPDPAEPRHRQRVIIIGDSMMFGMSLGEEEVFVGALARSLPDYDFWSFAADDWGTTNELAVLKEFIEPIRPDVVLLAFYENDFRNNEEPMDKYLIVDGFKFRRYCPGTRVLIPEEELMSYIELALAGELDATVAHPKIQRLCRVLRGSDPPPSVLGHLKNGVATFFPRSYRYLAKRVRADFVMTLRSFPEPLSAWLETVAGWFIYVPSRVDDREIPKSEVETTGRYVREIQELCQEYDSEFHVLIIPDKGVIDQLEDPSVDLARRMLEELDVSFVDARPLLRERGARRLYWQLDGHLNPEGNEVLVEAVLDSGLFGERSLAQNESD